MLFQPFFLWHSTSNGSRPGSLHHPDWPVLKSFVAFRQGFSHDSKVHGANMGPTWVLSSPGGPHVGPMNLAIWEGFAGNQTCRVTAWSLAFLHWNESNTIAWKFQDTPIVNRNSQTRSTSFSDDLWLHYSFLRRLVQIGLQGLKLNFGMACGIMGY